MNTARTPPTPLPPLGFIGGGNMASAIIGGLIRQGVPAASFEVVEPLAEARARLAGEFGIMAQAQASPALARCKVIVWAVKPQSFAEAAQPVRGLAPGGALHLSVAAGIPSGSIARWLDTEHVVRAMPNTPALVGQGVTGLFAREAAKSEHQLVERVLAPTGALIWVDAESALDAVTAVSGSGPAYVFYFIEAMAEAGVELGLTPQQAHQLAIGTFTGASALAASAAEPPEVLRSRVTSKGGTTHAAITSMESADIKTKFKTAIRAAHRRAVELGREFGG